MEQLSDEEKRIIGECLHAVTHCSFFRESEFRPLFGYDREEIAALAEIWPNIEETETGANNMINNSLLHLSRYPCKYSYPECQVQQAIELSNYTSASPEDMKNLLNKFRKLRGQNRAVE